MRNPKSLTASVVALGLLLSAPAFGWNSEKVKYDAGGRLFYPEDAAGNRIPDYSHAGYKGGGVALPVVPVVQTISPITGDNTAHIQAALNAVGALPVQADGYRGTLLLAPGVYQVDGTLRINQSGVVLAGSGDGTDPATSTILRRTNTSTASVIIAGGNTNDQFKTEIAGTRRPITTQRVAVGSYTFTVDDASGFAVGDNVVIHHPSTAAWIAAMENGGVTDENVWKPGEIDIRYHRYITAISGNTLAVDAPVYAHLDRGLAQSTVYKYNNSGILRHLGIEDLRIDILTNGPTSEDHATDAIQFTGAEDSWIRDCTMNHFVHAGVQFSRATRCTAERVRAIEPHSVITGERRYNFATYHAQLILFRDCYASESRHAFVMNGTSNDSGIVALNCTVERSHTYAEAHRRWSTGLLFDSLTAVNRVSGDVFGFYNRGNYGTGHGWAAGHSVIWRTDAGGGKILVQQPPMAQNYAIGSFGNVTGSGPWAGPAGFREGTNVAGLQPQSLYLEQLAQRQAGAPPLDLTAPTAVTLSSGGSSPTSALLNWTAATDNAGIAGYDVFASGKYAGTTTGTTLTVGGLTSGTAYSFVVQARDVAGNTALSNPVSITTQGAPPTPVKPTLFFEAELLARTSGGGNTSVATEDFPSPSNSQVFASNFQYVSLSADGNPPPPNGEWMQFTLPNVPAGTYNIRLRYKSHPNNRGRMTLLVDGAQVGGELNQRSSPATFLESDFGIVRFTTDGDHVVRLAITGKDAAAAAWGINADRFSLVPDKVAPVIAPLADRTAEATSPEGAVVTFAGTATDDKDGAVPVEFTPASGSTFPLGTTLVVATAEDITGNIGSNSFHVTVVDTTPPALTLPADLTVEATGPAGAPASFSASAVDLVAGTVGVSFSHEPGSTFPLGTTLVTASAQDDFDHVASGSFAVTVRDTTPPVIITPPNAVLEATGPAGAVALFGVSAHDLVNGELSVALSHPSGGTFPLGTTLVTATAQDASGNPALATFTVTVRDTTAPTLTLPASIVVDSSTVLGAPVTFAASATDAVSGSLPVALAPASGSLFPIGTTVVQASALDAAGNTATGSFTITVRAPAVALVRHAPTLNGTVNGSVQQLLPESATLNGNSNVTGEWLVPGTPTVRRNGNPAFGGSFDANGSETPSNYQITLNGGATLGRLIRRVDAVTLPVVAAPDAPTGTRSVALNSGSGSIGPWETLRSLTLNGNVGPIPVPAGAYGSFVANGGSSLVLGVAGATTPSVYHFQSLLLNGNSALQVVGPVIVIVNNSVTLNASCGASGHPEWLDLRVAGGGLTLNGGVAFHGFVTAPTGTVTVNGNSQLTGGIIADRLTLNGNAVVMLVQP